APLAFGFRNFFEQVPQADAQGLGDQHQIADGWIGFAQLNRVPVRARDGDAFQLHQFVHAQPGLFADTPDIVADRSALHPEHRYVTRKTHDGIYPNTDYPVSTDYFY